MSERMNNLPEKWQAPKPWKAKCGKEECKVNEYELTESNSAMVDYPDKRECNFLYSKCPGCNSSLRMYTDGLDPEEANKRGLKIVDDEAYPDDDIFEEWLRVKGHELPETYELTHRHEALVQKFGETITAITEQAPELFMDVMSDPAPSQTMPQRWV